MGEIGKIIGGEYVKFADTGGGINKIDDMSVNFSESEVRENIAPTDTVKIILGKVMKWFSDLSGGAASTLLGKNLTAGKVLVSDENGKVSTSYITNEQINYLDGLKGNIQSQIDNISSTQEPSITNILDLVVSPILEENSWNIIKIVAENHLAERYWNLRDTKETKINYKGVEVPVVFEIADFEHESISGSEEKANITFITKYLFGENTTTYKFTPGSGIKDYTETIFNTTVFPDILEGMEKELFRCVKTVKKKYNRIVGGTDFASMESETLEGDFKLFLLSQRNLNYPYDNTVNGTIDIDTKYSFYKDNNDLTRSFYDSPENLVSGTYYWLREMLISKNGEDAERLVGAQNKMNYAEPVTRSHFIIFAFCI